MDNVQRIVETLVEENSIKFKNGLYQYTQVLFAYNSNKIEGSEFSEEQIAEIYERNTITTFGAQVIRMDDLFEAKNHFRLVDYMLDHYDDAITEEMLQFWRADMTFGSEPGKFEVFIGADSTTENKAEFVLK